MPKELDISDDEDSIPSGLDEDGDGGSLADLQDDFVDDAEEPSEIEDDDDDEKLSLVESSDAEDLIPLDEAEGLAFKDGLIDWPGDEDDASDGENEDDEWTGFGGGSPALGGKRKRNGGKEEQKKRKKVRSLPTFASYEDYAKLIEEGPEDDI
jgi:ribosome biogenesis protein MAK21